MNQFSKPATAVAFFFVLSYLQHVHIMNWCALKLTGHLWCDLIFHIPYSMGNSKLMKLRHNMFSLSDGIPVSER